MVCLEIDADAYNWLKSSAQTQFGLNWEEKSLKLCKYPFSRKVFKVRIIFTIEDKDFGCIIKIIGIQGKASNLYHLTE